MISFKQAVAILVNSDDQPRDELGRFADTGGGGVPSKAMELARQHISGGKGWGAAGTKLSKEFGKEVFSRAVAEAHKEKKGLQAPIPASQPNPPAEQKVETSKADEPPSKAPTGTRTIKVKTPDARSGANISLGSNLPVEDLEKLVKSEGTQKALLDLRTGDVHVWNPKKSANAEHSDVQTALKIPEGNFVKLTLVEEHGGLVARTGSAYDKYVKSELVRTAEKKLDRLPFLVMNEIDLFSGFDSVVRLLCKG